MLSRTNGIVSVWIGHFPSEEALFAYLDWIYDEEGEATCLFAQEAATGWFDHDFQEAQYLADGLQAPETALLAHSWAASFVAEVAAAIRVVYQDTDTSIVLLYDYAYTPVMPQFQPTGPLRFVGAFGYSHADE